MIFVIHTWTSVHGSSIVHRPETEYYSIIFGNCCHCQHNDDGQCRHIIIATFILLKSRTAGANDGRSRQCNGGRTCSSHKPVLASFQVVDVVMLLMLLMLSSHKSISANFRVEPTTVLVNLYVAANLECQLV